MIDTKKYEGHTPAPWEVNNPDDDESLIFSVGALKFVSSANTRLMADAPLLLERVIHLEHILKCAKDVLTNIYTYDKDLEDAEWIAWFCDMEGEEE
tara:strand:+ start:248 stop:535 length:288 start_codon:yes stop_codon:yes gene_type:complete